MPPWLVHGGIVWSHCGSSVAYSRHVSEPEEPLGWGVCGGGGILTELWLTLGEGTGMQMSTEPPTEPPTELRTEPLTEPPAFAAVAAWAAGPSAG